MSQLNLAVRKSPKKPLAGSHGLVVLSGGQDSVTCLGLALKCYEKVSAIGFDYGQTHRIELAVAANIAEKLGVSYEVMKLDAFTQLDDSALVNGGDVNLKHARDNTLPASFVPNRNAIFMTLAHAYAQKIGAKYVVTGVSQTDYSGYPDCRKIFIKKLESALNTGYNTDIKFITPLTQLNKAQTFEMAEEVGVLDLVLEDSHTCYNGIRELHDWGRGCGKCPACLLRMSGYDEFIASKQCKQADSVV